MQSRASVLSAGVLPVIAGAPSSGAKDVGLFAERKGAIRIARPSLRRRMAEIDARGRES